MFYELMCLSLGYNSLVRCKIGSMLLILFGPEGGGGGAIQPTAN